MAADIADDGLFFEVKRAFAPEMVAGLVRLNGTTTGIVANRTAKFDESGKKSAEYDSVPTPAGCDKAAKFVSFCDAFNIPVITLTNVTGFASCECCEKKIAGAAAKLAFAFADADVPKINVVIGNAMGSAYNVMNSKGIGADLTIALPDSKIGIMDAKLAASIIADGKSADEVADTAKKFDALQNSVDSAASRGYIDEIVNPEDLRKYLIGAVEMLYTKQAIVEKKHGTV